MVAFTGLRDFLSSFFPSPSLVCLFGWGVFRHPIPFHLISPLRAFVSLEGLDTSADKLRLLWSACLAPPWGYLLLGEVLFTGRVPGVLNGSVPSTLIWKGCFRHPLRHTFASIAAHLIGASLAYSVLRGCLFASSSLALLIYFRSSDHMRRSDVPSNYHLLLFNGHLSLVLSLLSVIRGEEITV